MSTYEKLHLANNLDALDLLVTRNWNIKTLKFQQYCNALNKLYKETQQNILDQEKNYILLARYLILYKDLLNSQNDKKFVEIRFGSEQEKVLALYNETKQNLFRRYSTQTSHVPEKKQPSNKETNLINKEKPQKTFTSKFISSQQLISALETNSNILLVDARPDFDYAESRFNFPNTINVPDESITSGLSANILAKRLPEETQKIWENRDKFDVIVLFDWNTTDDSLQLTKLETLRSALVDWDPNRNYNEKPVILNGGYLDLLQTYPTKCINPLVYLRRRNNELDELLELDNVQYPTESDSKILVMGSPENLTEDNDFINKEDQEEELISKENLIKVNKDIELNREEVFTKLLDEEKEWKRLNDLCNTENDINKLSQMKNREHEVRLEIDQLEETLLELTKKKEDIKRKIEEKSEDEEKPPDSEQAEAPPADDSTEKTKIYNAMADEKCKALEQARALKPKPEGPPSSPAKPKPTPAVNRATKPGGRNIMLSLAKPMIISVSTTSGMKNIRNTCYMNTILQVLANLPPMIELFCEGYINRYSVRTPAAIIYETASAIRSLWSKESKLVEPSDFYNKVCTLEPTYKLGHHEDCMEFFLFLLNHVSEDCSYQVRKPDIMTPKQIAWYNQFQGRNSIFIDYFYHQIRIKQECSSCHKKTFKFEIESTFMLSVPETEFKLEELMNEYMDSYVINDYCCSKCKKPVTNYKEICYEPKIIVIILKRYRQLVSSGELTIKKINSKCHFPKTNFRIGNGTYKLHGIALHSGNMNYGHYTAGSLTGKGWYELNDEFVRPMNIDNDSIRSRACAFFYCRRDK